MATNKEVVFSKLLNYRNQVAEQSVQLWKSEGAEAAYAEEQKILTILQEELRKRIREVEREKKQLEPMVKITESILESQKETLEINSRSAIIHTEHEKCVVNEVEKYKEEVNNLLNMYSKHIDQRKQELENNNPEYKILKKQTVQKKKMKLDCMLLEKKIEHSRYESKILKEISYKRIINFSKSWLDRRLFEEKKNTLNQLKLAKENWLRKLMEVMETSKFNQKMRYMKETKYTSIVPQIKFSQPTETKPVDKKSDIEKNKTENKASVNESSQPFSGLQLLLENQVPDKSKQTKTNYATQHFMDNTGTPKSIFKSNHSKVLILDNQVLNPKTRPTLTKEERSKENESKLQKAFTNLKRKMSHQLSSLVARVGPSNTNITSTETKKAQQDIRGTNVTVEKSKTKDVLPSQESLLYSQEESEMRFVSQQSEVSAERNMPAQVNTTNQSVNLDVNQNERAPTKLNKRVTFSDKDTVSDSFFGGSKQMDGGMIMKKDNYPFAMMNMNSAVGSALKSSEKEYKQFSMSFAGAASGAPFSNFTGMDEGLFKIPNNRTGNALSQNLQPSQHEELIMEDGSNNLNLNMSYNTGDISVFSDTDGYGASMMLSPTDNYEELIGTSINQGVAFNFGTMQF